MLLRDSSSLSNTWPGRDRRRRALSEDYCICTVSLRSPRHDLADLVTKSCNTKDRSARYKQCPLLTRSSQDIYGRYVFAFITDGNFVPSSAQLSQEVFQYEIPSTAPVDCDVVEL